MQEVKTHLIRKPKGKNRVHSTQIGVDKNIIFKNKKLNVFKLIN